MIYIHLCYCGIITRPQDIQITFNILILGEVSNWNMIDMIHVRVKLVNIAIQHNKKARTMLIIIFCVDLQRKIDTNPTR